MLYLALLQPITSSPTIMTTPLPSTTYPFRTALTLLGATLTLAACQKEPHQPAAPAQADTPTIPVSSDIRAKYAGKFRITYVYNTGGRVGSTQSRIQGVGEFYFTPTDSMRPSMISRSFPLIRLRSVSGLEPMYHKEFGVDAAGRLFIVEPWGSGGFASADSLNSNLDSPKGASSWHEERITGSRIK
jgi:hypothetical protein